MCLQRLYPRGFQGNVVIIVKIINANYGVAARQQRLADMKANKARRASD